MVDLGPVGGDDPTLWERLKRIATTRSLGDLAKELSGGRSLPDIPLAAAPIGVLPLAGEAMDAYELADSFLEDDPIGMGASTAGLLAFGVPATALKNVAQKVGFPSRAVRDRAQEYMGRTVVPTDLGTPARLRRAMEDPAVLERAIESSGRTGATPGAVSRLKDLAPDMGEGEFVRLTGLGEAIGYGTRGMPGVEQAAIATHAPAGIAKALQGSIDQTGVYTRPLVSGGRGLRDFIESGIEKGGHLWYDTQPVKDLFVEVLGPDEGVAGFNRFMETVGATSAMSDVDKNIWRAFNAVAEMENPGILGRGTTSLGFPRTLRGTGYGNPSWWNVQVPYLQRVRDLGGIEGAVFTDRSGELADLGIAAGEAQKMRSFVQNLMGNAWPSTIDRHAARALTGDLKRSSPEVSEYLALAEAMTRLGREYGLTPSAAQGAVWSGASDLTNVFDHRPFSVMFDRALGHVRRATPVGEIGTEDLLREVLSGNRAVAPPGYSVLGR